MLRRVLLVHFLLLCVALLPVMAQRRGGRYDGQIRAAVSQTLAGKADYKNVKAEVEDGVVTLTGSVELDSTRRHLVTRLRGIPHLESVRNELVLYPPAVADKALFARVQRNLADAGFSELKLKVHEGAVTLQGQVRDFQTRQRVLDIARRTEGVKEVDAQLTFAAR